ncbi:MAG: endonuclease/exonuclease/phosphatase family protein [Gemmatimonas sp.]
MTFNIAAGTAGGAGGDSAMLARIARVIRESDADIVALQEVDVHWSARSLFADQADVLARALGMHVRFAPIYHVTAKELGARPREFGVALLSRFPVTGFRNHELLRLSTQNVGAAPSPAPGFLEATVIAHGVEVRVFNTHLDYRGDPAVRIAQVREMLAVIGDATTPTLLFGDLNATPDAPELQPLFRTLHDVWNSDAGAGLTYPAKSPAKRIDFVLGSSHFRARAARVIETDASDHRPVVADVLLFAHH